MKALAMIALALLMWGGKFIILKIIGMFVK
jgi:hypothetical protein